MRLAFLIVAIGLFVIGAALDFGWLHSDTPHVLGLFGLGLGAFAAAFLPLPGPGWYDRR